MVRPYDTRRRQVVPIQPARRGELRVYACGPTVYRAGMSVQSAPQGPWSPATPTTPYGNAVSADESGLGQPNIIRYTGGALGQTTSLTKLGQRYYNLALRALTQQDTIALLASPQ